VVCLCIPRCDKRYTTCARWQAGAEHARSGFHATYINHLLLGGVRVVARLRAIGVVAHDGALKPEQARARGCQGPCASANRLTRAGTAVRPRAARAGMLCARTSGLKSNFTAPGVSEVVMPRHDCAHGTPIRRLAGLGAKRQLRPGGGPRSTMERASEHFRMPNAMARIWGHETVRGKELCVSHHHDRAEAAGAFQRRACGEHDELGVDAVLRLWELCRRQGRSSAEHCFLPLAFCVDCPLLFSWTRCDSM
jgi:hypothetical protein